MAAKKIALLWIAPADYDRAVALSDDGMPATYEAWRDKMEKFERNLPADVTVVRVEADPDEVAKWCRAEFGSVTTKSRSAFAAAYLMRKMDN